MESLQVARRIVAKYADARFLTNLKLNLLVYWCQVEALRATGTPLFADAVVTGEGGPVEPAVWETYRPFGSRMIRPRDEWQEERLDADAERTVAKVVNELGPLTAIDLLDLSCRPGGAWNTARERGETRLTADAVLASADVRRAPLGRTLARSVGEVTREYPNALRMLERS